MDATTLILSNYESLFTIPEEKCHLIGIDFMIPQFDESLLSELADEFSKIASLQNTLLKLMGPIVVVGDIHGNIVDLFRIFARCGHPQSTSYLFLGDYVDRGQFSIEVITLLFALGIRYKDHIFLLRGNHEFLRINSKYGFLTEIFTTYGEKTNLHSVFNDAFNYLPIGATINDEIFCVHGGIAIGLHSIQQINEIKRPIYDDSDTLIEQVLWADPSLSTVMFDENLRGCGITFGSKALQIFLQECGLTRILRGHQCVRGGVQKFDNRLYTIFSSSFYDKYVQNNGGVLVINNNGKFKKQIFSPVPHLERQKACFYLQKKIKPLECLPRSLSRSFHLFDLQQLKSEHLVIPRQKSIINVVSKGPNIKKIKAVSLKP